LKNDNMMNNNKHSLIVILICMVVICVLVGILSGIIAICIMLFYGFTVFTVIGFSIHLILSAKTITKNQVLMAILSVILLYFSFKYSNQILTIIRGIISKYA